MSTPPRLRSVAHQPALDGLRAVAVLAVMAYHADVRWMRGGYLGVDAFFVLSGFLITGLLLAEHTAGGISLGGFWTRRLRRLLPALLLVLAAVTAVAAAAPQVFDPKTVRDDGLATLAYAANWKFTFSGAGYFEQFAAPSPLRHMWSLAIEEQFYLLWPLAITGIVALRPRSRRALPLAVPLALAAASALLMALLTPAGGDVSRAYYGTDTRAQGLLVGATLAALVHRRRGPTSGGGRFALEVSALGAVAGLGWAWSTVGGTAPGLYHGGYLVLAVAVALVIVAAVQPSGMVRSGLAWRPLQGIGRISYGLYLWHWPAFLVLTRTRTGWDGPLLLGARFAATFVAALLSYHLVEQPVRQGAPRGWRGRVAAPVGLAAVAVAVALTASTVSPPPATSVSASGLTSTGAARPGAPPTATVPREAGRRIRLMLTGDSTMVTLAFGIAARVDDFGLETLGDGRLGCPLLREFDAWKVGGQVDPERPRPGCDWSEIWPGEVRRLDPDVVLVMFGPWDAHDRRVDGAWLRVGTAHWRERITAYLREATDLLSAGGARVVLATSPYHRHPEAPGQPPDESDEDWRIDALNQVFQAYCRDDPRVTLYDLHGVVSPGGEFTREIAGLTITDDGVHLNEPAGELVMDTLGPVLAREGRAATRERAAR